jgi:hypothetical protein
MNCQLCAKPIRTRLTVHVAYVTRREAAQATFCSICWAFLVSADGSRAIWAALGPSLSVRAETPEESQSILPGFEATEMSSGQQPRQQGLQLLH